MGGCSSYRNNKSFTQLGIWRGIVICRVILCIEELDVERIFSNHFLYNSLHICSLCPIQGDRYTSCKWVSGRKGIESNFSCICSIYFNKKIICSFSFVNQDLCRFSVLDIGFTRYGIGTYPYVFKRYYSLFLFRHLDTLGINKRWIGKTLKSNLIPVGFYQGIREDGSWWQCRWRNLYLHISHIFLRDLRHLYRRNIFHYRFLNIHGTGNKEQEDH